MTNNNRTTRSLGAAGAAAFLLLLTAGAAPAISPDWKPGTQLERRQRAMRASQIAVMDIFGQNYGGADFSLVIDDLESHPADAGNAAFMSVPLSLANVYLNRYETGGDKANLDRAVLILGWVADRHDLWSGREHTGSVVSYLDISLARARAECDVGGYESAIDEAWSKAMALTAGEADALLESAEPCGLTLLLAACADSDPAAADSDGRGRSGLAGGSLRDGVELPLGGSARRGLGRERPGPRCEFPGFRVPAGRG